MIKYNFKILLNRKGFQTKRCEIIPPSHAKLESIVLTFQIISELKWFKTELLKAIEKDVQTYTGLNAFECHVTKDFCEIGYDFDKENFKKIPTKDVLRFVDEAIDFYTIYNNGEIPGIIPASKKDDWIIVPKNYVKEEYT